MWKGEKSLPQDPGTKHRNLGHPPVIVICEPGKIEPASTLCRCEKETTFWATRPQWMRHPTLEGHDSGAKFRYSI